MLLRIGHSRAVYEVNLNSSTSVSGTNVGVDGRKVTESETILPASATKMVCILFSTILVWFLSVTWALQSPTLTKKRQLCRGRRLKMVDNKRLLNKAEYDMNNYEARGGCYPPRPETKVDNSPPKSAQLFTKSIMVLWFIQNISKALAASWPPSKSLFKIFAYFSAISEHERVFFSCRYSSKSSWNPPSKIFEYSFYYLK